MQVYVCWATHVGHMFKANSNADRVPQSFGQFVCKEHLAYVNKCRADKGLEPLIEFPDSYEQAKIA